MPGRNRTGPMGTGGTGAMPGREFGNCAGKGQATDKQGVGKGGGQVGGSRKRWRMFQSGAMQGGREVGFDASPVTALRQENQTLARHNEALRSELDAVKKRLDEVETRTGKPDAYV